MLDCLDFASEESACLIFKKEFLKAELYMYIHIKCVVGIEYTHIRTHTQKKGIDSSIHVLFRGLTER